MNRVVLIGRLTKNPELRFTHNRITVSTFTIAVDRRTNKEGKKKQTLFLL